MNRAYLGICLPRPETGENSHQILRPRPETGGDSHQTLGPKTGPSGRGLRGRPDVKNAPQKSGQIAFRYPALALSGLTLGSVCLGRKRAKTHLKSLGLGRKRAETPIKLSGLKPDIFDLGPDIAVFGRLPAQLGPGGGGAAGPWTPTLVCGVPPPVPPGGRMRLLEFQSSELQRSGVRRFMDVARDHVAAI